MKKKINRFEDFEVWEKSMHLVVSVYKNFRNCKDYSFRDQIQRAAVSVPANFSEGYERNTNKEFIRYINIANGSNAEVRTLLYLALELNYLEIEIANHLIIESRSVSAMLITLRAYRQSLS